ncbi:hypothetical protein SLOPH_2396 [Spraguea lophii 42_110]|uniref:DDT domain-containing protein n=1 Tax=Spraguea lophii (strain 42_110) TaxID=1358809 RepID=S7W8U9_SPRLO|nr:hypothetical protein SLOPH_2396 [Spraguea lophii 42_110]
MIESVVIRKYIIQYFLDNGHLDLWAMSKDLNEYFSSHFLSKEYICIKKLKCTGRIVNFGKSECMVAVNVDNGNKMQKINTEDITRRDELTINDIKNFLETVTQENLPFGRMLKPNILESLTKPKTLIIKPAQNKESMENSIKVHQKNFKVKTYTEQEKIHIKRKLTPEVEEKEKIKKIVKPEVNKLTEYIKLTGKPLDIKDIDDSMIYKFLDIYGFCKCFGSYLGIFDFSLENFATQIFDFKSNFFFEIIFSILKILISERKRNRTEGLKEIILDVQNRFFKDFPEIPIPEDFKRIQWFNQKITIKIWKSSVKSFLFDISSLLGIKNIFDFKILDETEDNLEGKMDILRFLFFIALETNTVKGYLDEILENFKRKEKKRNTENNTHRKLRYEFKLSKPEDVETRTELQKKLDSCQSLVEKYTTDLYKSFWKIYVGKYDGKPIYCLDNMLIYQDNGKFFEYDGSYKTLIDNTENHFNLNYNIRLFVSAKIVSGALKIEN